MLFILVLGNYFVKLAHRANGDPVPQTQLHQASATGSCKSGHFFMGVGSKKDPWGGLSSHLFHAKERISLYMAPCERECGNDLYVSAGQTLDSHCISYFFSLPAGALQEGRAFCIIILWCHSRHAYSKVSRIVFNWAKP